jgi:hypothetical protein
LIFGNSKRRTRALAWSTLISALLHVVVLTLVFYEVAHVFVQRGERESVSETRVVTIRHEVEATPRPVAVRRMVHSLRHQETAPAHVPLPELAKQVTTPATPAPPQHRTSVPSKIERDEAGYAKEIARLNAQDDPHAIPTIEPNRREPSSKQYAFNVPAGLRGDEHGNGYITPTQRWHDNGRDCYYGRYEFTYPDGSQEDGDIVWPFCYEPALDPFRLPPHLIPFPLPLPGYRLPPDTQLPPKEKSVYQEWAASGGSAP